MFDCEDCTSSFYYEDDLEDHINDYGHWPECETCTSTFRTKRARNQHMNSKNHWAQRFECETCTLQYLSRDAVNQHMTAAKHWTAKIPCETCDRRFHTQNSAAQHMNAAGHWTPKIPCETCDLKFHSQAAANEHMDQQAHHKRYCKPCGRWFQNENNLKMHLNSRVHRGATIRCPFCSANYTTASGLMHHLETGSCPGAPKLNRETILRMVRERDPHGVITEKQIEWHKNEDVHGALNAHLNSPVHKQKVYHCPNAVRCGKQFVTLAGLFHHLESEACGFMRFEKVQGHVGDVLQGRKLIAFA